MVILPILHCICYNYLLNFFQYAKLKNIKGHLPSFQSLCFVVANYSKVHSVIMTNDF